MTRMVRWGFGGVREIWAKEQTAGRGAQRAFWKERVTRASSVGRTWPSWPEHGAERRRLKMRPEGIGRLS